MTNHVVLLVFENFNSEVVGLTWLIDSFQKDISAVERFCDIVNFALNRFKHPINCASDGWHLSYRVLQILSFNWGHTEVCPLHDA